MERDIVERLREAGALGADMSPGDPLCAEAADEIEQRRDNERILWADNRRLQAEVERLRAENVRFEMRLSAANLIIEDYEAKRDEEIRLLKERYAINNQHQLGPQKSPSSAAKVEAEAKQLAKDFRDYSHTTGALFE